MAVRHAQGRFHLGIPNLLSILRLILIPIFVGLFFSNMRHAAVISAGVLIFSGFTDVLDGIIARKFNMVTDLGRILDPLADKLTQVTVCVCLVVARIAPLWLVALFLLKEVTMIAGGARIIKKGNTLDSSKWFGKLSTVVFYVVMILIIALRPNEEAVVLLILVSLCFMLFSLAMYIPVFLRSISAKEKDKQ